MRSLSLALLLGILAASDPCQQLCRRDGPAVCTAGSWNKNGFCHGYTLQAGNGYCYHSSATAHTCPSSPALGVADAQRLLATVSPTANPDGAVRAARPVRTRRVIEDVPDEELMRRQEAIFGMAYWNPNKPPSVGVRVSIKVPRETPFLSSLALLQGPAEDLRSGHYDIGLEGNLGGFSAIREWSSEVSRQISDPATGLLEPIPDAPSFVRIKASQDNHELFHAMGRFLGWSLASYVPMSIPFPSSFYARLLGKPVTLEDIREEDPQMYRSLQFALQASEDELSALELTIGGQDFQLTPENRNELVNRKLNEPCSGNNLFEIIRTGFAEMVPIDRLVASFSAAQLRRVMFGAAEIGLNKIVMQYEQNAQEIVQKLRNVLSSFTQTERRLFVKFVTESSQVSVRGLTIEVRLVVRDGDAYLPRISTCFHSLNLPNYSTEAVLKLKLIYAMTEA